MSDNRVFPLLVSFVGHIDVDHIVAVGELVVLLVEHNMIAVLRLNNAGVANLTVVQSPILEGLNIVGIAVDILDQTAGRLAAGIIALLACQLTESFAVLLFALLELFQDSLGLFLSSLLFSLGVGGYTGFLVLSAASELNQNVLDICQGSLVIGAALEQQDIVAVNGSLLVSAGLAFDNGDVASLASAVSQPLLEVGILNASAEDELVLSGCNVLLVLVEGQSCDSLDRKSVV